VKFKLHIDNAEHAVEASADGTMVVDGRSFKTKMTGAGTDKRLVQVGDKSYEVRVFKRTDGEKGAPSAFVFEVAGERVPVSVKGVSKSESRAAAPAPVAAPASASATKTAEDYTDGIFAPVPGKIAEVKVKVGDTVKEGDLVLILEAMKMENELHAPKQATIAAVLVNKGDQAAKGQLLVAFG
jgi:glutaconyl-CoA/methylmalonyl-CoA decarboxylase subunit gamma